MHGTGPQRLVGTAPPWRLPIQRDNVGTLQDAVVWTTHPPNITQQKVEALTTALCTVHASGSNDIVLVHPAICTPSVICLRRRVLVRTVIC